MFQLAMKLGLKGLGKLWKKAKLKFKKKPKTKTPKSKSPKSGTKKGKGKGKGTAGNKNNKAKGKTNNKPANKGKCKSDPVDVVTGSVFSSTVTFEMPGPIPFVWERFYYSNSEVDGPLGYNWTHRYHMGMREDIDSETGEPSMSIRLEDGRIVSAPVLLEGESYFDRIEQFDWLMDRKGYQLIDSSGLRYRFEGSKDRNGYRLLSEISTADGFRIKFSYTSFGHLIEIVDSRNQKMLVDTDYAGRILCIYTYDGERRINLVKYKYDNSGNMVETVDASNLVKRFEYHGHLMTRLTNEGGISFHWEYDGTGENARCIHAWGDGGIMEYRFEYEAGMTRTRNGLGATEEFYYNDDNLIYKIVDANGGITQQLYNEYEELEVVVNPEGLCTKSAFNENGKITLYTDENGESTQYMYDEEMRLSRVVMPGGSSMSWEYDGYDRVVKRSSSSGESLTYSYNGPLLQSITDMQGRVYTLAFNKRNDLTQMTYPNGLTRCWDYDALGRLVRSLDLKGNETRYQYDHADHLIQMEEPDGNIHRFAYDPFGNLLTAGDKLHDVAFRYGPTGNLTSRIQNGRSVHFAYDSEIQLRSITNEGGERYLFELDGLGQVVGEKGFDGMERTYIRDGGGRVRKVIRPGDRCTSYTYDGTGNVVREEHHDESWTAYRYNPDGQLTEAINENGVIRFMRDREGRILEETQGEHTIKRTFNKSGDCTQIASSLGADIRQTFDAEGNLTQLQAGSNWQADWQRDRTGLELHRQLTGGVSVRTDRDRFGREIHKSVGLRNIEQSSKRYQWGLCDRLHGIFDERTGKHTSFDYDAFDNLVKADYQDNNKVETIYRAPDVIGNLFETPARNDRRYDCGGRLTEDPNYFHHYDCEGNLIFKEFRKTQGHGYHVWNRKLLKEKYGITAKGSMSGWLYEWDAGGMLSRVINPNHGKVTFGYDALGRRAFKESHGVRTHWVWDGNVPLHEWQTTEKEPLIDIITWVFEDGTFVPTARITDRGSESIITDYLGTPTQMYDADGKKTWEAELDIYGRVRTFAGRSLNDCPFRYQGQYFDCETGLGYNRFRYIDYESGNYISQDPIGLDGGNPTIYGYVNDPNNLIDSVGLFNASTIAPSGRKVSRTVYRYEMPARVSTTWTTHIGNIGADHRYTQSGIGGVYGSNSPKTALAEVSSYGLANDVKSGKRILVSEKFQMDNVLDLTDPKVRRQLGVTKKDLTKTGKGKYDITQKIGKWAKKNGYDGILAPSARNKTGSNLMSFEGKH